MIRFYCFLGLFAATVGCGGPTFTHLGNGVGVPSQSIERVADERGISRAEARQVLQVETAAHGETTRADQ